MNGTETAIAPIPVIEPTAMASDLRFLRSVSIAFYIHLKSGKETSWDSSETIFPPSNNIRISHCTHSSIL
jgi:hypothetical protein